MILVTGATGNVGSVVLRELSRRGAALRALTRDPDHAHFAADVEVATGSTSDRAAMESALAGADAVFLNVVGDPQPSLEALARVQPRRVVLLSSLTAGTRPELSYASHFAALEVAVREVAPSVCVLRPGQFASNASWWQPMLDSGVVRAPFLDVALPPIAPEDVGAVAAEALCTDDHAGRTLLLSGPAPVSPRQQIATIARVTGRSLSAVEIGIDEFGASIGLEPEGLEYLTALMGHPRPEELQISPTVAAVTGRDPLTFEEWTRLNREMFA